MKIKILNIKEVIDCYKFLILIRHWKTDNYPYSLICRTTRVICDSKIGSY